MCTTAPCYCSARRWHTAAFDTGESWIMFVRLWPWSVSALGKCFRFEPGVNGIYLMDKWISSERWRLLYVPVEIGFAVFPLLESARRSACVSKLFLRWINQWQWTSHWSDSPLLLISLPWSQALWGFLFDVLVPCLCRIHSGAVRGRSRPSLFSGSCHRACWDCK